MPKGKLFSALARERANAAAIKKKEDAIKRQQEAVKQKALKNKRQQNQHKKLFIPFGPKDRLLLVGEGDFSYSCAILKKEYISYEGSVVCTGLDSREDVLTKYPSTAPGNLEYLESCENASVQFGVDATKLMSTKPFSKQRGSYNGIVFNFPHLGNSVSDQARNILQHQTLLLNFFDAAIPLLTAEGTIVVTLFESEPYISWNIKKLAKSKGLKVVRSQGLDWASLPGYGHRLTAKEGHTNKEQVTRPARIYVFGKNDPNDTTAHGSSNKKRNGNDSDSDSD